MEKKIQTIKVFVETLKKLRMLHALTGETMQNILDRLVKAELERFQNKSENS
jgi:hypothetical protein